MKLTIITRAVTGAAALVAVCLSLAACSSGASGTQSPSAATSTPLPGSVPTASGSSSSGYKDGTYTVTGIYGGAPSYITVTMTLADNAISNVDVGLMADNNDTSRGYQERFAAAVPDEVAGKSIEGLEVGKIAGASGCADGFNDALAKIRDQAANET